MKARLTARLFEPTLLPLVDEDRHIDLALRRLLLPHMNCLDVGCHLGAMLRKIRRLAPRGKHIAFEPTPYKHAWLTRRYREVDIRPIALSDAPGNVDFFVNDEFSGLNGLAMPVYARTEKTHRLTVPCARLDDLIPVHHRIDFMKIDVEGAELLVLRGATQILRRDRPVLLFECTRANLEAYQIDPQAIADFLTDLRYQIYLAGDWLAKRPPLTNAAFLDALGHPPRAFDFLAIPARPSR